MKKHLLSSALILAAALVTTSCMGSGDNRWESNINYGGSLCFNYVTDMEDTSVAPFVSLSPQYSFLVENFSSTITTTISNVRLTSAGSPLTFKLPAMQAYKTNPAYTFTCTGTDIMPEGQTQAYLFDSFKLGVIDRYIQTASGSVKYSPVYDLSYTINDRYRVTVFPTFYDVLGTMSSTVSGTSLVRDTKNAIVSITLNPDASAPATGKATLELLEVDFAEGISVPRLIAEDIPYTVNSTGIIINTDADTVYKIKDNTGRELAGAGFSNISIRVSVPSGTTALSLHANITGLQGENESADYDLRGTFTYYYDNN